MAENIDAERAAFEAWAKAEHENLGGEFAGPGKTGWWYWDDLTAAAWDAWQAARRTPSASIGEDGLPRLPRFPKHYLLLSDEEGSDEYPVFVMAQMAEYARQYARDAIAADRRARGDAVDDLSMLVRQLVHSLKNAKPNSDLAARAVDYLQRKGLAGNPLRAAPPLSSEQQAEKGDNSCGS